jgi:predicted RNase H-like nuclease (RuvC/YqgF family)
MNSDADKLAECMAELATYKNINAELSNEITHIRRVNEMLRNEFRELEDFNTFVSRENDALKFKLSQLIRRVPDSNVLNTAVSTTRAFNINDDSEGLSDYSDDDYDDLNYNDNPIEDTVDDVVNGIADMIL